MERREHWETVYQTKKDAELSWFQDQPTLSLAKIGAMRPLPRRVIDVGGGQSALAGQLLGLGVEQVTVLDISGAAIQRGRERLGAQADRVRWITADVLEAGDLGEFDLWHDRAVFHFLTKREDRSAYAARAAAAVIPGGSMIVATFALEGPPKCSGLDVCRYDAAALAREFAPFFEPVSATTEVHRTPWGSSQAFTYAVFRRIQGPGGVGGRGSVDRAGTST
ncbi:MAG: class I SAM-dependent methyltransferase [Phycisphaerae bacterium]|nr:class I SAM-dependent methyltransferase [Phycisphaerae bacterium]